VAAGSVLQHTSSILIDTPGHVQIDGSLEAGRDIKIIAETISIRGTVQAGDAPLPLHQLLAFAHLDAAVGVAPDGLDGGSIHLIANVVDIAQSGVVSAGDASDGLDIASTLTVSDALGVLTLRGGDGGNGGNLVIEAGRVVIDGLLRTGAGGDGGDALADVSHLSNGMDANAIGGNGGMSGELSIINTAGNSPLGVTQPSPSNLELQPAGDGGNAKAQAANGNAAGILPEIEPGSSKSAYALFAAAGCSGVDGGSVTANGIDGSGSGSNGGYATADNLGNDGTAGPNGANGVTPGQAGSPGCEGGQGGNANAFGGDGGSGCYAGLGGQGWAAGGYGSYGGQGGTGATGKHGTLLSPNGGRGGNGGSGGPGGASGGAGAYGGKGGTATNPNDWTKPWCHDQGGQGGHAYSYPGYPASGGFGGHGGLGGLSCAGGTPGAGGSRGLGGGPGTLAPMVGSGGQGGSPGGNAGYFGGSPASAAGYGGNGSNGQTGYSDPTSPSCLLPL
jgi:hypothetical protein